MATVGFKGLMAAAAGQSLRILLAVCELTLLST